MPRRRLARIGLSCIAFAPIWACTTPAPPDASGLPPNAQTLRYLLDEGCFSYLLGERSERAAMRRLKLNRIKPLPFSIDPIGPPMWLGHHPGLRNVVVGPSSCSIHMHGRSLAGYPEAVEQVLRRRFGSAPPETVKTYEPPLPGQVMGCRKGLRYTYYPEPQGNTFTVDLNSIPNCATDPLLELGKLLRRR